MTHRYQTQEDIIIRQCMPPDFIENAMSYQPYETDSVIVGYPRSGITWLSYVLYLIQNGGKPIDFSERLWETVPEMGFGRHVKHSFGNYFVQLADMVPHPRLLRTHLPYEKTPIHPKAKCIYISRNPFDTAVSLYRELWTTNEFSGNFEDFFTYFLHGQTDYNDYFEHQKGWFQRKTCEFVLWITFEDLYTYPRTVIKQIGNYMGGIYERHVNDEFIMREIIKHSSFREMKSNEGLIVPSNPNRVNGYSFFQNGKIGDFKTFFTDEQINRLVEKFKREFFDLPLIHSWDKYNFPINKRKN